MWLGMFLVSLAAALAYPAWELGGPCWLLVWPAWSALGVGVAYLARWPGALGKRADGRLAAWAWLLWGPYLAFAEVAWRLQRRLAGEDPWNEVAPNLFLGRRVEAHELPPSVDLVVDLTAEFPEPPGVRAGRTYRCLPTLDATAPEDEKFVNMVDEIQGQAGRVYVHCASGHGRSAAVCAALFLRRGWARDVADAEAQLRNARPWVRLKRVQVALVQRTARRN